MGKKKLSRHKNLLWQIHRPGKEGANYIFGTMHTRDHRVHAFIPLLEPYIKACKTIATEFELPDPGHIPNITFSQVEDWWNPLTKKQQRKITQLLADFGLGAIGQYQLSPPLLLIQALTAELLGKEEELPFDLALAQKAQSLGLQLSGIETIEEQVSILYQIPVDKQIDQLLQLSKDVPKFKRGIKKQVNWFLSQDIRQLYKDARKHLKALRKLLLLQRNKIMADRMVTMFDQEPHFIAIGAAHLWGGKGVLQYLRRKGYSIQPVPLKINND